MSNVKELTLHLDCNANMTRASDQADTARAQDIAMLVVKPIGESKATPRVLAIHPTKESFLQAHSHLKATENENGVFVPSNSYLFDTMAYPMFTVGGTSDAGWGLDDFYRSNKTNLTLNQHTRCRVLAPELCVDDDHRFERDDDGECKLDRRWMAKTKANLLFPISRCVSMGRLLSQFLCDYKARNDDQLLDWARNNQEFLTRRSAQQEADAVAAMAGGQQAPLIVPKMPKSIYSSKQRPSKR